MHSVLIHMVSKQQPVEAELLPPDIYKALLGCSIHAGPLPAERKKAAGMACKALTET